MTELPEDRFSRQNGQTPLVSTHTHTDLSLCGRPDMHLEAVVKTAADLGFALVVLCDHIHPPTVTDYPRHLETLKQYKQRRAALSPKLELVVGAEFEVTAPGRLIAPEVFVQACECAIVAPNHYQLDWVETPSGDAAQVAGHELDTIETAIGWAPTAVVAHPFAGVGLMHSPNDLYAACDKGRLEALFDQARERRIAFEIQPKFWGAPQRAGKLADFFERWLAGGGKVALGSDAHTLPGLAAWAEHYPAMVTRFQLRDEDLWWPKDSKEPMVP